MYNKELLKDFINYGIIASIFLIIPYSNDKFILIITMLIVDLINLYLLEKKGMKNAE